MWVCEIDASSFVGLSGFKLLLGARDEIGVLRRSLWHQNVHQKPKPRRAYQSIFSDSEWTSNEFQEAILTS